MNNGIDFTKTPLNELYGRNCFSESIMRERLPKSVFRELKRVQEGERELSLDIAEVVANAMKDWAIEKGATHYTHWFQPLTGLTAEKHDSFISPTPDGKVIMEFSGKELIKGEPDASSFPSGGLRATFEARGYTAWDTTSPAFVKEETAGVTLYIPTAFISYNGQALDKKVPLLASMDALNRHALRILKVFGTQAARVTPTIGPEQEYFLLSRDLADRRSDLLLAGRTLFGARPPKGQEMEDHYYGSINVKAAAFMRELNYELWKLGISAKTQHNEVAPNQFEIATIYSSANVAADKNQLVMDTIKKVANRHGMAGLLHEKPFAGVNGSGKHMNWSLATDTGVNLLEPGEDPHTNAQFLVFLVAVIKAVDTYAALLRTSAANSGNDHRLGANEAPPAIISIFLGDQLQDILDKLSSGESVKTGKGETLKIGITNLPSLPKDITDRNRTSPFAFTGNKFEFRMVGSSASIASPAMVLNTAVADILDRFASALEKAEDLNRAVHELIVSSYTEHRRIIFNGNGYSREWIREAEKRGLPNIPSTVEAIPEYTKDYAVALFGRQGILSRQELESRASIYLEKYAKQINIEARVMVSMAEKEILPAAMAYGTRLGDFVLKAREAAPKADVKPFEEKLAVLVSGMTALQNSIIALGKALESLRGEGENHVPETARGYRERVVPLMEELRRQADLLEGMVPKELWPFPTYEELLFRL